MEDEPDSLPPISEPGSDGSGSLESGWTAGSAQPEPTPGRTKWVKRLLVIIVALVVTGGIAAGAIIFLALRGTEDVIDRMVPGNTTVYVTAYLDPALQQKLNLRSLSKRFPKFASSQELNRRIDDALNDGLRDLGLNSADVRPWLGTQMAALVSVDGDQSMEAFLIASKDEAAATVALAKIRTGPEGSAAAWKEQEHEGVTISVGSVADGPDMVYALVDHVVVLATDAAIVEEVIDTAAGKISSLRESADFAATQGPLPKERVALAYVNIRPLVEKFKQSLTEGGEFDLSQVSSSFGQLDALTGLGATLSAEPTGIALDLNVGVDATKLTGEQKELLTEAPHENSVLSFTPKDAYGVFALTGLRQTMQSALDELAKDESFADLDQELGLTEMVGHLTGDYGLEAAPAAGPIYAGEALLVGTDDDAGMQAFLDGLASRAAEELEAAFPEAPFLEFERKSYKGVTITYLPVEELREFGVAPAYAVSEGMTIIASSPDQVQAILDSRASGDSIAFSQSFIDALGPGGTSNNGMLYIDIEAVVGAYRNTLDEDGRAQFDVDDAPDLAPLRAFAFTSTNGANRTSVRWFLLIR